MYKYKIRVAFKHKNNVGKTADYTKTFTFIASSQTSLNKQINTELSKVVKDLSYGGDCYVAQIISSNKTKYTNKKGDSKNEKNGYQC